jgi:hypothetical protein
MLLGFGAENQFENYFFLASISCVSCVLDFSVETLLNWNRGPRRRALHRSGKFAIGLLNNSPLTPKGLPARMPAMDAGSPATRRKGRSNGPAAKCEVILA